MLPSWCGAMDPTHRFGSDLYRAYELHSSTQPLVFTVPVLASWQKASFLTKRRPAMSSQLLVAARPSGMPRQEWTSTLAVVAGRGLIYLVYLCSTCGKELMYLSHGGSPSHVEN
jgi:hypothetical protein